MDPQGNIDSHTRVPSGRPRVCAVRYLNTVPLVWGMLHGSEHGLLNLSFSTPAVCADRLESGTADVGIVPVVEVARLGLEVIPGACIACRGEVRSILLVSKLPLSEVRTLATDSSSRTSVMLARLLLAERHGVQPTCLSMPPDLRAMLAAADAALVIGDPALRLKPGELPYQVHDLGEEWFRWTGKPMVFAVWAGRPGLPFQKLEQVLRASALHGARHIDEIVEREAANRRIPAELARTYLTRNIHLELGENEREGMELFLERASRGVAV